MASDLNSLLKIIGQIDPLSRRVWCDLVRFPTIRLGHLFLEFIHMHKERLIRNSWHDLTMLLSKEIYQDLRDRYYIGRGRIMWDET